MWSKQLIHIGGKTRCLPICIIIIIDYTNMKPWLQKGAISSGEMEVRPRAGCSPKSYNV